MNEEIPEGFEIVNVPIHEVAYLDGKVGIKDYGDGRVTHFYQAAPDQWVRTIVDNKVTWAPVAGFSEHRGCEVVIINLANGGQIVSDHDPRAVAGIDPSEDLMLRRFYPLVAQTKRVLVPFVPQSIVPSTDRFHESYSNIWDTLESKNSWLSQNNLNSRLLYNAETDKWEIEYYEYDASIYLPVPNACINWLEEGHELKRNLLTPEQCDKLQLLICEQKEELYYTDLFFEWQVLISDTDVSWTSIESVDYTGKKETGYDLTVPGSETFMAVDGTILSNTINLHVPSQSDAVQEAWDKLMPSKMLFATRDRESVVPKLKHEQILGMFAASQRPSKQMHRFATEEEALNAISTGRVNLNDEVEIG